MKKIACEIHTTHTVSSVENLLNIISSKEGSFSGFTSSKYLIGKVENLKFQYKTYTSPPMEINGEMKTEESGTRLFLNIKSESMKGQLKAFTYAFLYPFIFVCILVGVIKNSGNILIYIGGLIALGLPVAVHKIYMLLHYHEPNPEHLITKLAKNLNGRIENKKYS